MGIAPSLRNPYSVKYVLLNMSESRLMSQKRKPTLGLHAPLHQKTMDLDSPLRCFSAQINSLLPSRSSDSHGSRQLIPYMFRCCQASSTEHPLQLVVMRDDPRILRYHQKIDRDHDYQSLVVFPHRKSPSDFRDVDK